MKNKAKFKFNNGNLALLCSGCSVILKEGYQFTPAEMMACKGTKGVHIPPQYCEKCKEKRK